VTEKKTKNCGKIELDQICLKSIIEMGILTLPDLKFLISNNAENFAIMIETEMPHHETFFWLKI